MSWLFLQVHRGIEKTTATACNVQHNKPFQPEKITSMIQECAFSRPATCNRLSGDAVLSAFLFTCATCR